MAFDADELRWPDVADLLSLRADEAMALNQRYLNPQLGRVLRTLGFDREWVAGQGSHLIDREGHAYLDLIVRIWGLCLGT